MSESLLDPERSPGALRAGKGAGVRRVNKLPLAAAGGLVVAAGGALIYAVLQRAPAPEGPAKPAATVVEDAAPRPSSRAAYESVVAGFEDEVEIPAAAPAVVTVALEEVPVTAPVPLPPAEPSEVEKWRFDLLRDAVAASPVVAGIAATEREERPAAMPPATAPGLGGREELLARALSAAGEDVAGQDPNLRARKEAFGSRERRFGPNLAFREPPVARYTVSAGTVIPAVLVAGIDSDLPGLVSAQVSREVLDTAAAEAVLIPQGSRLLGSYDHHVALGQRRVMVAWHRIQFPDASTLELGGMPGTDGGGFAGFSDQVDNHYARIFGGATMLSVIGAGAQLSQPDREDGRLTARQEAAGEFGRQWGEVGREMARGNMRIQPTLRIRPGYRFNVMVTKDLLLEPYEHG